MLNLNEINPDEGMRTDFSLIPAGTVCRAIIKLQGGDTEISAFGLGNWFKCSSTSKAKWADVEFTIIGGDYDRRKVWDRIFIDGDKMSERGAPMAQEIGMRTIRAIVDSAKNLQPSDQSETATSARQVSGIQDLNGMEICMKVGIKKGTNGYEDTNNLMVVLTPNKKEFISGGNVTATAQPQQPQVQQPQVQPQQAPQGTTTSNVPSWATK